MEQSLRQSARPDTMDRRRFLRTLGSVVVAGLAVTVIGCTEDPLSAAPPASPGPGDGNCALGKAAVDRSGTISNNHGHEAVVTTVQQDAETAFDLSIMGSSGHDHTVALTTQDLEVLKAGDEVVKTSSNSAGHTHTVTFVAAPPTSIRPC